MGALALVVPASALGSGVPAAFGVPAVFDALSLVESLQPADKVDPVTAAMDVIAKSRRLNFSAPCFFFICFFFIVSPRGESGGCNLLPTKYAIAFPDLRQYDSGPRD